MSQQTKTPAPPVAAPATTEDLSKAIEQAVERQPDEEVKTVRVFGDRYRCNWWVREKASQALYLNSARIRRSRFLRVTRRDDKLIIEDLSQNSSPGIE